MIKITKTVKFADWMAGLTDMRLRAKIAAKIDRMAFDNPADIDSVGDGISGLRIHYGPGYQVYFIRRRVKLIVLLCGCDNRTQVRLANALPAKSEPASLSLKTTRFDSAKYLHRDEAIKAYLEEVLETDDPAFIAHALGVAARARGMPQIVKKTGLSCGRLRKTLSHEGNPKFGTIVRVMRALGLRFSVTAAEPARRIVGTVIRTFALTPSPAPEPAASRRQQARGGTLHRSARR